MSCHAPLRGVAEAAEAIPDRTSYAEMGRITDHVTSTIARRYAQGIPVVQWPGVDLLRLARIDGDLRRAIIAYLEEAPAVIGDASLVIADLCAEAEASGALATEVRRALADGVLTAREIDSVLERLEERQAADAALARDLRAKRKAARV